MAAPKKKPAEAPEPINQYGLPRSAVHSQLTYDLAAFAFRLPVDSGAPARPVLFKRISNKITPGYFEWHSWTDQIVEAGCNNQLIGNPGCSNCVAGHTKIDNPVSGYPTSIRELCEGRIAPMVMTLDGPRQAGVPFLKGVAQLYEVVLDNGSRFEATADHRVLLSDDKVPIYARVGDLTLFQPLLGYEPSLLPSISEHAPSIRVSGAPCSRKTIGDFLPNYFPYFRLYDEPLHLEEGFGQSFSPSPSDAQERNYVRPDLGDSENRFLHSPCSPFYRPSNLRLDHPHKQLGICGEPPICRGISERGHPWFQSLSQSHLRNIRHAPSESRFLDCDSTRRHDADPSEIRQPHVFCSCPITVAQTKVVSIRKTQVAEFYDITVPGPEHYFAEGAIHHNSAKTHNWTGFAVNWWLCYPEQSSVMFVSTSIKSLRRRAWAQVQKLFTSVPGDRIGNFVDSKMMWQARKGDDKHAIIGKAVEEGSTHRVADDIKGVHTKRQMVIVDEANSVPEAIWEAITNLYSYPKEFILVALANPRDRLSKFSRFIEPLDGWTSVDVNTEEWEGKPQKEYGNLPVKVIRFDAEKSPNIVEGKIVSKHLPTKEKVEAAKASGGGETPSYWTNFRGFPPPEGLSKTVFSESALTMNHAFSNFTFTGSNFRIVGAFDPAFGGGDRPALRFAKLGMISETKWGIEVGKPIILPINAHSTNPVHFQLAEQLRRECEKVKWGDVEYACLPENLAVDATGEGGGLCDIIQRTWSPNIIRVEFGGAASEDSASLEDVRPANEVYDNKSCEMWFRSRDALNAGQLRGIDHETGIEFCNRLFDDSGKRTKLQKKNNDGKDGKTKGYKQMYGKSCDLADTVAMILEVARRKGFKLAAVGKTVARIQEWSQYFKAVQEVHATADYAEDEDDYEYA